MTNIVPFGRYKGQSIENLIADKSYCQWISQQEFFRNKFSNLYTIIHNNNVSTRDIPTPEHNKLQNMFLKESYIEAICKELFLENIQTFALRYGKKEFNQYITNLQTKCPVDHVRFYEAFKSVYDKIDVKHDSICGNIGARATFEAKYNWDVEFDCETPFICIKMDVNKHLDILDSFKELNISHIQSTFTEISYEKDDYLDIYIHAEKIDSVGRYVYMEIKPLLGDDYPCVLRKMKKQIDSTNEYLQKQTDKHQKEMRNHSVKYIGIYILFIGDFQSSVTSLDELKEIFKNNNIKIIFVKDIDINQKQLRSNV